MKRTGAVLDCKDSASLSQSVSATCTSPFESMTYLRTMRPRVESARCLRLSADFGLLKRDLSADRGRRLLPADEGLDLLAELGRELPADIGRLPLDADLGRSLLVGS